LAKNILLFSYEKRITVLLKEMIPTAAVRVELSTEQNTKDQSYPEVRKKGGVNRLKSFKVQFYRVQLRAN
jgi:hypothetical protein